MIRYFAWESRSLVSNLLNGVRTALFSRRSFDLYHVRQDQVVWLVAFNILLAVVLGYLSNLPDPTFYIYGIHSHLLTLFTTLFSVFLIGKILGGDAGGTRLMVVLYSVSPIFLLGVHASLAAFDPTAVASVLGFAMPSVLLFLWGTAVLFFIMATVSERRLGRATASLGTYIIVTSLAVSYVPAWDFWYPKSDESDNSEYTTLLQEQHLYLQPELVDRLSGDLLPGSEDETDVYYLGFAGYSDQDVFMKEVMFAKQLFETRFNAAGRTAVLINNYETVTGIPLATRTNLRFILNRIGKVMDREEDILFLYLTSHGSQSHNLSVTMWPYTLDQINPQDLKLLLDEAGIRNRVLMISACYSGGFVDPLKDENTLVITAAAADKQSFGCSNEAEFTYFGRALLADHLQSDASILAAYEDSLASIRAREKREGKEFSEPQLFIGSGIRDKLVELDAAFAGGQVASAQ
jgi:hypothetical protein